MKRCIHCKSGKVPESIMVKVLRVFSEPGARITVLSCPWCENPLSASSLAKLNGRTVEESVYRIDFDEM